MILILLLTLPVWLACAVLYVRFSPGKLAQHLRFEVPAFALLVLGMVLVCWFSYDHYRGTPDAAWWTVLAFLLNAPFVPVYLLLAGLLRYALFRSRFTKPNPVPGKKPYLDNKELILTAGSAFHLLVALILC